MRLFGKVILIILDSLGVGALADAAKYGDTGANTIGNLSRAAGGLDIPVLEKLGIGNITDITGVSRVAKPMAYFTRAAEISVGKDTLTGHWEIMGIRSKKPLKTFTNLGFPKKLILRLEKETGREFIGNIAGSGTEIINDLGEYHLRTGKLILYTSTDSVLQIAAHENIISNEELYRICKIAREITMCPKWKIGRIIARPFKGKKGNFIRTSGRHDFALLPPGETTLDYLREGGYETIGIGKISDIFSGQGITDSYSSKSNDHGMKILINVMKKQFKGLVFLNLVDFDMKYGHRRDFVGYAKALKRFDSQLLQLLSRIGDYDLLILTADHGNDPTHRGSDHTREFVPVLIYAKNFTGMKELDTFETFANIGATIADNFGIEKPEIGESILHDLK